MRPFFTTVALLGCAFLVVQMIRAPETSAIFADREVHDVDDNAHGLWSTLEHASGQIGVMVDYDLTADRIDLRSAGLVRTARLLARGEVMIPKSIWSTT